MSRKHLPAARLISFCVALLHSMGAYASFNSFGNGPLCQDYNCVLWVGSLVGVVGIPVCASIFLVLSLILRGPRWPKVEQTLRWILVNGVVAYTLTIALLLRGSNHDISWAYVFLTYCALATGYLRWLARRPANDRLVDSRQD